MLVTGQIEVERKMDTDLWEVRGWLEMLGIELRSSGSLRPSSRTTHTLLLLLLLLRSHRVAGLRCEEVVGYCKGLGYQTGDSFTSRAPEHIWNAVEIGGLWFLIDSCWGSGEVNLETKTFHSRYNEFYFLTSPEHFVQEHFPLEPDWQFISPPISLREFQTSVHLRPSFYSLGMTHISPRVCVEGTERRVVFSYRLWGVEDCGILSLTGGGMSLALDPPRPGLFRLEIFAGRQEDPGRHLALLCDFLICSRRQRPALALPVHPPSPLGHNWLSVLRGLAETSHPRPLVWTADGSTRLAFTLSREMEVQGLLHANPGQAGSAGLALLQNVRSGREGDRVYLDVRLPGQGVYLLSVCRKQPGQAGDTLTPLCRYLLACPELPASPRPFPELYYDWRETYSVTEPSLTISASRLKLTRHLHVCIHPPPHASNYPLTPPPQSVSVPPSHLNTSTCSSVVRDLGNISGQVRAKPSQDTHPHAHISVYL
uniref:KY-like immunoglobulin-like domain-containing protein n=1 Tax=Callorhinchus milii TaxID=7868 RepID=A0A4W3H0H1_CALMI